MDEVIIDGCNVAECCCFDMECQRCLWQKKFAEIIPTPLCKEIEGYYFKQLQKAKAENERLKAITNQALDDKARLIEDYEILLDKYEELLK